MRKLATVLAMAVSVVAILAVSASAATAANFKAKEYPATIEGSTTATNTFGMGTNKIECHSSSFKSASPLAGESPTLAIAPAYGLCYFVGLPVVFNYNGCTEVLHATSVGLSSTEDISCPEGVHPEFKEYLNEGHTELFCTIEVFPQTGIKGVSYFNNAGTLGLSRGLTGIEYEFQGPLCPEAQGIIHHNLSFSGSVTLGAKNKKGGADRFEVN